MRRPASSGEAEIPVLPLVDILFSAFAAILATSIVVAAMIRTRVPEENQRALPHFTMFVQTDDQEACPLTKADARFTVRNGEEERSYTLASQFSEKPQGPGVDAWYFRTEDAAMLRAELAILTATAGTISVWPDITRRPECDAHLKYSFVLGMESSPGQLQSLPSADTAKTSAISIEVAQ